MGFEVKANPATVRVMRKWAERGEEEAAEFNSSVDAFTKWLKEWGDNASNKQEPKS